MNCDTTLILFKPDAVKKNIVGECLARFQKNGLCIRGIKMMQLDTPILTEHYAHIFNLVVNGKRIFPGLLEYMTSGPVIALALYGEDAITKVRNILGATDPAKAAPGTIRADFAENISVNVCHASDSPESAEIEIKRFFKDEEIFSCPCCK